MMEVCCLVVVRVSGWCSMGLMCVVLESLALVVLLIGVVCSSFRRWLKLNYIEIV